MDTDLLAEIPQIRQAGSLSNNMPKPWEQFSSQAGQSGPWNKFQPAVEPGSPEAIQGIEDGAKSALHALGATARPWGPLGVAAAGGAALGSPGGFPGMAAGAGVGAGAYGLAHLIDLPLMAVNAGAHYAGYPNVDLSVGRLFDNFVNQYNPLPEPQTKSEEYLAAASGGIKDAIGGNRAGVVMKGIEVADRFRPVFQGTANALADAPKANAALGAASGVGAQFGSDVTDGSTSGMVTGALTPVMAAVLGRGAIRGGVNAMGGPESFKAFGRGLVGRGEDVTLPNGEVLPASFGLGGARLENARQAAESSAQSQITEELVRSQPDLTRQQAIDSAISNLETDRVSGQGYRPTAGSLSDNPGMLAMENGLFQNQPAMRGRYQDNFDAVSGSVAQATQPVGASIQEGQGFFSRLLSNRARAAEQNAQRFEDVDMNRANDLVDSRRAAVTSSATADQQTAASTTARRQAGDMMVDEKAAYQKLYAAVPRETPITFENSLKAGEEALAEHGVNAGVDPSINSARERIGAMMKDRAANPETTFGELESDLKIVNGLISQAERAGQNQATRLYVMFKEGLIADREAGGAANTALRQANNSFKTFQNRWANGPAGEALDRGTLPSETMGKYMSSPEGAAQFNKTVGTTPQGKQAAGDYLSASVAKASGATPTKQSVTASINKNPAISTFPEVKAAEQAKARQISAATTFQGKQAGKLEQMKADSAAASKQADTSLPGKFSKGSPDAAVSTVSEAFGSKDSTSAVNELLQTAKLDKSGKSMDALKNATRQWLGERLFNKGKASLGNTAEKIANEDLPTSMNQLGKMLAENGPVMKNLRRILTKDEIDTLLTNHRRLEMSGRIRQSVVGSQTNVNKVDGSIAEGVGNAVKGYTNIPAMRNLKSGATLLQNLGYLAKLSVKNGRAEEIADNIKLQAFLDPDKMKQLLLRPTESNWKRTSWARQQMNILMQEVNRGDGQKDDDNEEKPTPAPAPKKAAAPVQKAGDPSAPRRMRWNPQTGQLEASE
jgi:hypothetical protein